MRKVSRRTVLAGGGAALALLISGPQAAAGRDRALATSATRAVSTAGTTLAQVATPDGSGMYRRLTAGPGFPLVVREDLAAASATRDGRRTAVACFAQLTDLHLVDAQSPLRFEQYAVTNASAFRPHEALGTQGAARLVSRINALPGGPFSGRPLDCAVSTGDATDNGERVELDWYLSALNGGGIRANTGSTSVWEGVQASGDGRYYNPELAITDRFKARGFPELPGFLGRATAPHRSDGLRMPWYAVFGNHDDSVTGSLPNPFGAYDELYTGPVKFTGFTTEQANRSLARLWSAGATSATAIAANTALATPPALRADWVVTADERRRPFTRDEFVAAHLAPGATGAGPVGHGFDAEALASGRTWYEFTVAPGVIGLSLDSTNPAGLSHGSLSDRQFRWLEASLAAHSDEYVIAFSHHTSRSMDSPLPDPDEPDAPRHSGAEVLALLTAHPAVVAWVNGHTHADRITAHRGADARHSLWEINTASHVDFPQHARVIELCRNDDGTLSLFTTLLEADAPYRAPYDDASQLSLASLYRELAFNDPHRDPAHEGTLGDRNTELLLSDPLA